MQRLRLDFTRALYLGFEHPSRDLPPWPRLTDGRPAVLGDAPRARRLGAALAALMGGEAGTVGPSTLHLFFDLFGLWRADDIAIWLDAGSYAIARWGVERAAARGAMTHTFPPHDAATLSRRLARTARLGRRPVIVADGWSPDRGPAPVARLVTLAREHRGWLVIDDTQALGVIGPRGGGVLAAAGIKAPEAIAIASLAKGFGAPIAVLCGEAGLVRRFEAASETRVHCSPPSAAAIAAGCRAVELNERCGDARRRRLRQLVERFRRRLGALEATPDRTAFPIQSIEAGRAGFSLYEALRRRGVRTVLRRDPGAGHPLVTFLITARHRDEDIDRAVDAVKEAVHVSVFSASVRDAALSV